MGPQRVGARLSPTNPTNYHLRDSDPAARLATALELLSDLEIAYVDIVEGSTTDEPATAELNYPTLRRRFRGRYIANNGFKDLATAERVLRTHADLISFGRLFIANPDLPKRLQTGAPLNPLRREFIYSTDHRGYTDYTCLGESDVQTSPDTIGGESMNPNLKAPTQRTLLKSAAALSLLTFAPGTYGQSSYPDRPIKIIKPLPAGTSADTMARYVADQMSKDLGQPVVVDNRPGASSNIGYRTAAEADADGYTLLYGLLSLILNPQLFNQVPYKLEDFTPVIRLLDVPFVQIPRGGTPEEFAKSLATETENWGRVIKTANLKTE